MSQTQTGSNAAKGNKVQGQNRIVGLDDELPTDKPEGENPAEIKHLTPGGGGDLNLSGEKVVITVYSGDGDLNKLPVFISLNGYAYQFPRDKPVVLPKELLGVLKDAEQENYTYVNGALTKKKIKRFSFNSEPYIEGETVISEDD